MDHIWEDEEYVINIMNYIAQQDCYYFKLLVSEDNDDTYIPNFSFDYIVCDCSQNWDLKNWLQYFEVDKPVIFINTASMFKSIYEEAIKNYPEIAKEYTGAGIWAQNFYFNYRDKMWSEGKSKFIILVEDDAVTEMINEVNSGFTIELIPYYYRKIKRQKKKI